jgi:ankyrin repeat protein
VEALLAHDAKPDIARTDDKKTPLYAAVEFVHVPCVKALLNKGANTSLATKDEGNTPLHFAATYNMDAVVTVVKELVNLKNDTTREDHSEADPFLQNLAGITPFQIAKDNKSHKVLKIFTDLQFQNRAPTEPKSVINLEKNRAKAEAAAEKAKAAKAKAEAAAAIVEGLNRRKKTSQKGKKKKKSNKKIKSIKNKKRKPSSIKNKKRKPSSIKNKKRKPSSIKNKKRKPKNKK